MPSRACWAARRCCRKFRALGDSDEDEFLFDAASEDLDLPPAIAPIRRQLLLATLIRRWDETRRRSALGFAQATALADSLAKLMDELERQGADLARLEELAPLPLAEHWAGGRANSSRCCATLAGHAGGRRRDQSGRAAQSRAARAGEAARSRIRRKGLVIAAGSTGSIPATGELLRVIARLPNGAVVLPGLDRDAG